MGFVDSFSQTTVIVWSSTFWIIIPFCFNWNIEVLRRIRIWAFIVVFWRHFDGRKRRKKICEIITAMHKLWKPPKSWNDLNTLSDIWWLQTFLKSTHKSNLFDLCWKANSISYMCTIFDLTEYLSLSFIALIWKFLPCYLKHMYFQKYVYMLFKDI